MQKWKRRLSILLVTLLSLAIAGFVLILIFPDFLVDFLWFQTLGYELFFILRVLYRYLILFFVTLLFFLLFFFNFWIASRYLGSRHPEKPPGNSKLGYKDIVEMFRSGSMTVYTPLSLVLAVFIAYPLFEKWQMFLFYIFGPSAGAADPAYGNDVGFYLFSYPVYTLLQERFLISLIIILAASIVLYYIERRLLARDEAHLPKGARIHLNVMAVLLIGLFGWSFMLQRYGLLYSEVHMNLFYGPGFTEMNVTLPLIWASFIMLIVSGALVLVYLNNGKLLVPAAVSVLLFAGVLGLRYTTLLPDVVQKYLVLPNELVRERPYIKRNIDATLAAYGLSEVETRQFSVQPLPWTDTAEQIRENITNIPVWDRPLLDFVYDQLQGIRQYYNFTGADVDRYTIADGYYQVNLAARELSIKKLPSYSHSWVNRHLQYTHGYGLVMTPAAQSGEHLLKWYVRGITPEAEFDFPIEQPAIYYGLEDYEYVIAPNEVGEIDYPLEDRVVLTNYQGEVGVPVSNLFSKLLFAVYFKDRNIFFTTKTNNESKILFRRNFRHALGILTPFFQLDEDPYLVVTPKGLFWIQDAYTRSEWYPYSAPFDPENNYIRNSVKIVIDAYDGTIDFYIADPSDPIIRAYSRMFPDLLKPMEEMPEVLINHIRYPKDIFKIQMKMYLRYHQTDPDIFYRDEDLWEFAKRAGTGEGISTEPYYVTLNLIDRDIKEFLLLSPMSPVNRPNMRALAIAGCDGDRYGKFFVLGFPKGEQVYGPGQINALIDQNTEISEQFTLWNQMGSRVNRGRMIIVPIGNVVFYIQPVYMSAEAAQWKIPQLQRLIVSQGEAVVMDVSLERAFDRIEQIVRAQQPGEVPQPLPEPEVAPLPEDGPEPGEPVLVDPGKDVPDNGGQE